MIWLWMALLALLAVAPIGYVWARRGTVRYRRETAVALHRAQLDEIERDRADGRLPESEFQGARLEVQRRLLAADAIPEPEANRSARGLLIVTLVAVPIAALALFVPFDMPFIPSEPHSAVMKAVHEADSKDDALIAALQRKLAEIPPNSPRARQGYLLLGQALVSQHKLAEAAKAWNVALSMKFNATLAAETAEAETEAAGHVTPGAAQLFHQALAKAPANAPWRSLAEQRLREAAVTLPATPGGATSTP
ncbi:MAG: c-type cytochrome biogenesis protein CcmI [Acidiphilium sp.]|uniref:C-type cytochrome biogenesis protein CcmI n=1 Tax=Acidiphilium acidophilum TaxID=76588 RepID=A0AAW9DVU4_ACIAO|nr:c-type cytochrome biogenesis protein CcmI [Acidiphilium acidophilum]MDD2861610.1 c-type cytochrome biogenesis protein CcmI [Acidiphilium sp.]MDX5932255.1 c-type cytochrome biogenesis protein CcmI [Acidiphilium acidophilum]